jgi:hypothetical protein
MFWAIIIILIAAIVCISWLAGMMINKRNASRHPMSRQEQLTAAKLSGAFPVRKENRN